MSFQSLADVFAYVQTHDDLTTNEVVVLLAIAHHANQHGASAYPTLETLGTFTKLARRTIRYTLRRLEEKQVLETVLTRGKPGKQTYELLLTHVPLYPLQEGHHMPLDPGKSKKGENPAYARDNAHAHETDIPRHISPEVLNYPKHIDWVHQNLTPGSFAYAAALSDTTPAPAHQADRLAAFQESDADVRRPIVVGPGPGRGVGSHYYVGFSSTGDYVVIIPPSAVLTSGAWWSLKPQKAREGLLG